MNSGRVVLNKDAGVFVEARKLRQSHSGEIENRGIPKSIFLWQTFHGNAQATYLVVGILWVY